MDPKRITQLRARFDWSQEQFGHAIGVANSMTISHWETGFRNPSGAARRFLCFLEQIPNSDFIKAKALLEKIAKEDL